MTIRLALLGAGLFARNAHIPALLELRDLFEIVAICSRTPESAEAANGLLPEPVPVYHDMAELLTQGDIDAVDIMLPIHLLPKGIKMALAAGKHVISEKPIAGTVDAALDLLDFYGHHRQLVWMVGEHYRYSPAVRRAAEIVRSGELGQLAMATWTIFAGMSPERPYYHTAWRRDGSFPGGFLLDGGVHFMAMLRLILGEVESVQAYTKQVRDDLYPLGTMTASLRFESGLLGSYAVTYAAGVPWTTPLTIVGERGILEVTRAHMRWLVGNETIEEVPHPGTGIGEELAAFGESVLSGKRHDNTPEEAMLDLALVEAMLLSAEMGRPIHPHQVVDGGL